MPECCTAIARQCDFINWTRDVNARDRERAGCDGPCDWLRKGQTAAVPFFSSAQSSKGRGKFAFGCLLAYRDTTRGLLNNLQEWFGKQAGERRTQRNVAKSTPINC